MSRIDCLVIGFIAGACAVLVRWGLKEAFTSHKCCVATTQEPNA